jgi:hypothetical protein
MTNDQIPMTKGLKEPTVPKRLVISKFCVLHSRFCILHFVAHCRTPVLRHPCREPFSLVSSSLLPAAGEVGRRCGRVRGHAKGFTFALPSHFILPHPNHDVTR